VGGNPIHPVQEGEGGRRGREPFFRWLKRRERVEKNCMRKDGSSVAGRVVGKDR